MHKYLEGEDKNNQAADSSFKHIIPFNTGNMLVF